MDALFLLVFTACLIIAGIIGEVDPVKIWNGLPRLHEFIVKILPVLRWESLGADLAEWFLPVKLWMKLLVETMLIAFLATVFGVIGAFILSFPASRNLMHNQVILFGCRRLLEIARTVPELVYALIFVFCFGIGPMAGVLAIAVHTMGALGKLYSEVNENIDMKAPEGLRADRGELGADDPLCGGAPGPAQPCELYAAALRDQRALLLHHRLRRAPAGWARKSAPPSRSSTTPTSPRSSSSSW